MGDSDRMAWFLAGAAVAAALGYLKSRVDGLGKLAWYNDGRLDGLKEDVDELEGRLSALEDQSRRDPQPEDDD